MQQSTKKNPGEIHTTEYGTLYGPTIGSALHDKFEGPGSKHTKNGNLLIIDYDTLEKLEKIHETKIVIKKITDIGSVDTGGEGANKGECGEHGEGNRNRGYGDNSEKIFESEQEKQDNNEVKEEKNPCEEEDSLLLLPSLPSRLHPLDTPEERIKYKPKPEKKHLETSKLIYGCYACKEFVLTDDKETYKKHCIETHPKGKLTTRVIPLRSFGNGEAKQRYDSHAHFVNSLMLVQQKWRIILLLSMQKG